MVNLPTYEVIDGAIPEQYCRVTALQAQALVNDFLSDSLPVGKAAPLGESIYSQS